ncbi:hypothetical protein AcW2_004199 [Taiwanofungus camphoratus]|nr:hypothetical protein AcW2_004199 [Antrodia cinnamomea]
MTWVYGWPLQYDKAVEYSKRYNLVTENPTRSRLYYAALEDISVRSHIDCVLGCWVDDELQIVFGLCIDEKARTPERAKIRFSQLPEKEDALVLAALLGVETQPKWYRYGSYNPYDEEQLEHPENDSDSDGEEGCYIADIRAEAERRRLAKEQGQDDGCEDSYEVEEDVEDPDVRSDDGAEGDENEQHENDDDDHDC